jgi:hypothetical protein
MKNLIKKYQIPTSGWDYWFLGWSKEWEPEWDDEEDSFELAYTYNPYFDGPVNVLPQREAVGLGIDWHRHRIDEHVLRAQNIIHASKDIPVSVMRARVKEALRWTRGLRCTLTEFINRQLTTYEVENGKKYFKDMEGRYVDKFHYWRRYITYIDSEGIVRKRLEPKSKKARPDRRTMYQRITWRRKDDKEKKLDRQRIAHFYLMLINNPDLRHYYEKILKAYEILNTMEQASHKEKPLKEKKGKDWAFAYEMWKWRRDREAFTPAKRKERDRIRRDLDNMMQGDFSSYYNSREYLYTLYKECHHFANP